MAVDASFRIQLEQFYIHDGAWCEPGGAGYNISLSKGSSEILIENGVSIRCNKVMVSRGAGAGSVTAYNYMDDGYICCNSPHSFLGADRWQEIGLNNSHMVGGHHMLFEGNWGFNMDSDFTHGNTIYSTYFRNWSTGYRSRFKTHSTRRQSMTSMACQFPGVTARYAQPPRISTRTGIPLSAMSSARRDT